MQERINVRVRSDLVRRFGSQELTRGTFDVTDYILDLYVTVLLTRRDHLSPPVFLPPFPSSQYSSSSVARFRLSLPFPSSPAKLSFALCDPVFLLAPLSFSLPGPPRRHHPPLSRPASPSRFRRPRYVEWDEQGRRDEEVGWFPWRPTSLHWHLPVEPPPSIAPRREPTRGTTRR